MRKADQCSRLLTRWIASGAVIALASVATVCEAGPRGFGGGGFGGGFRTMDAPHGPMMRDGRGNALRAATPDFQEFVNVADPGQRKGKRKNKGTGATVASGDEGARNPPRRRPPRRPPGIGSIGPIIGTGVAIGIPNPALGGPSLPRGGSAAGLVGPRAAIHIPPANERRYLKDEIVLEFKGDVSLQQTAPILARFRLAPLDRAYFALTDTTVFRWKVMGRRSVPAVLDQLRSERAFAYAQANFIYSATQQEGAIFAPQPPATPGAIPVVASSGARSAAGDPAQYALAKLRLGEAHSLATGNRVLVAVIDSGIDLSHPELQGVISGSFDALDKPEKPHAHGTAIAGAIASHVRLLGVAPAARILAIRAFGASGVSAESTSFAIIKGVQYATGQRARIINMSFAGPQDPGLARHIAAAKASGVVLIAASGNLGPKSPPQFPAADPNVIAVSATDAADHIFRAANRGSHIAVTAPGVDILLPAPNADYQFSSGTSFAAAHVSGIAALILERKSDLAPDAVRRILTSTARDLGVRGRDDEFGAGLVDAYQAILAVGAGTAGGTVGGPRPADTPPLTVQ